MTQPQCQELPDPALENLLLALERQLHSAGLPDQSLQSLRLELLHRLPLALPPPENSLRDAQLRFHALLEAAPDATVVVDQSGLIVLVNRQTELTFGYPRAEMLGHTVEMLLPQRFVQSHIAARAQYAAHPATRLLGERRALIGRRKDGTEFPAEISLSPLHTDQGLLVFSAIRDITRRQREAQALHASEERFRLLVEGVREYALFLLDPNGHITGWNSGAQRIKGYQDHEILGQHFSLCYTPEDNQAGKPQQNLQTAAQHGHCEYQGWVVRKDGSRFWADVLITALKNDDGTIRGYADLARDITDRRTAELQVHSARRAAEAANRAKDHFLAVLSHELRTPLTPVLAVVNLLEQDPSLTADVQESVAMIRRNIEIEARLVDDLLDVNRINRGKMELHLEPVDACQQFLHTVELCAADLQAKQLRIIFKTRASHTLLQADPTRFPQILWNLLKNAIKFTPNGGAITLATENPTPDRLAITITDTGVGIPPDVLPHIFDAFEQGGQDVTRNYGGLGLGLTITKALVQLHNGTIAASSPGNGQGASFRMEFPVSTATTLPADPAPTTPAASSQPRPHRILLVEDNADTAKALAKLLATHGYHVQTADTVARALHLAATESFDLLISDLGLPDGSGIDLMRSLHAHHPLLAIALSGYGTEDDIHKSLEAGFAAHLTKPVNLALLEQTIEHLNETAHP